MTLQLVQSSIVSDYNYWWCGSGAETTAKIKNVENMNNVCCVLFELAAAVQSFVTDP